MSLKKNRVFSTMIPSLLTGGLLIGTPSTMSAQDLVNPVDMNMVSCENLKNSKYCELIKKIESYRYLHENWDGYGGVSPKEEVVRFALQIVFELQKFHIPAPKAMVSGEGEVCLFWKRVNEYIEISLDEHNEASYFIKKDNDVYGEENCFIDFQIPNHLFNVLVDRSKQNTMDVMSQNNMSGIEIISTNTTSFLTSRI